VQDEFSPSSQDQGKDVIEEQMILDHGFPRPVEDHGAVTVADLHQDIPDELDHEAIRK
jgi:hypothetical protein